MSAYANDPRVTATTSGLRVGEGRDARWVDHDPERGWWIYPRRIGRQFFGSRDEAIRSLIGDPQ